MINTDALNKNIAESGYKMEHIAKCLGISRFALYSKINNKTEFKASEVKAIGDLLKMSNRERDRIFFA